MKNKAKTKDIIIKALSLGVGLAISLVLIAKVVLCAHHISRANPMDSLQNE